MPPDAGFPEGPGATPDRGAAAPERAGDVAALLLAAGSATRMGRNKMLLELGGESVVRRAVKKALAAGFSPVLVVTGHQADELAGELGGLDCTLVHNDEHETGIHTSVRAGVRALPASAQAAAVVLADMPFVTEHMLRELIAAYRNSDAPLVISAYGDVNAPPMLYDRSLFDELSVMQRRCGREVVRRHRDVARVMSWPTETLADLDTPDDYRRIREQLATEASG